MNQNGGGPASAAAAVSDECQYERDTEWNQHMLHRLRVTRAQTAAASNPEPDLPRPRLTMRRSSPVPFWSGTGTPEDTFFSYLSSEDLWTRGDRRLKHVTFKQDLGRYKKGSAVYAVNWRLTEHIVEIFDKPSWWENLWGGGERGGGGDDDLIHPDAVFAMAVRLKQLK